MYLARREVGRALRVYPLKTISEPTAWKFNNEDPVNPGHTTQAALRAGSAAEGTAATGFTRSDAINALHEAEEFL